jgi:hypothetical protein
MLELFTLGGDLHEILESVHIEVVLVRVRVRFRVRVMSRVFIFVAMLIFVKLFFFERVRANVFFFGDEISKFLFLFLFFQIFFKTQINKTTKFDVKFFPLL